ncbi:MAG: acyl-CoA/acyl-ACP dehydrogenase [Candidatus Helarchaeota archaeon]|nr:acyl-CoA/acyl-ACP dehydrogenase [Candidatus Helarchaeota archaeon]
MNEETEYRKNWGLSEEDIKFRNEAKKFVLDHISPVADDIEENDDFQLIREIYKKMGKENLLSLPFKKYYRGWLKDPGVINSTLLAEEICRVSAAPGIAFGASMFIGKALYTGGSDYILETYLKPITTGEKFGSICITEPTVGSDVANMKTKADLDGDEWVINGKKRFITNAGESKLNLIYCVTDPNLIRKRKHMSCIVVEDNTRGFSTKQYKYMGRRGFRNGEIILDNVRVPKENLVGNQGDGHKILMTQFNTERTTIAGQCIGIATGAFEEAKDFAKKREQFGSVIAKKQGIYFKIADMATKLDASRLLCYRVAKMIDEKLPPRALMREAAMAKMYASEAGKEIVDSSLQILGGEGWTKFGYGTIYHVERYYRDIRIHTIGGGTTTMNKYLIATKELDMQLNL